MEPLMQDLDLYTGKPGPLYGNSAPRFETPDPEYFMRMSEHIQHDERKGRKHATRVISFVVGLCIVAFTAGLVTGIKFAGGKDKQLIDPHTKQMISEIGKSPVKSSDQSQSAEQPTQTVNTVASAYPKAEFPFVIRLGSEFSKEKADEAASLLSAKGHTVILSKNGQQYRLYSGPFRTKESSEISLQKIRSYNDSRFHQTLIIKR
jgi:SPOR domain